MNALIILRKRHVSPLREFMPAHHSALVPIANKPLLDYLVDFAVISRCRTLSLVSEADEHPPDDALHRRYGTGSRWGISVTHGRVAPGTAADDVINAHRGQWGRSPVMVMDGLFFIHYHRNRPLFPADLGRDFGILAGCSTGSLIVSPDVGRIRNLIKAPANTPFALAGLENLNDLYDISMEVLGVQQAHYFLPGYVKTGDRIQGTNVRIHPGATIRGPIILGDHASIMDGASVGPYAILGNNSLVDKEACITHSVVLPDSYIGREQKIIRGIAGPSGIFDTRQGQSAPMAESQVVSALPRIPKLPSWLKRFNPFTA